jgi:hypothetical protein
MMQAAFNQGGFSNGPPHHHPGQMKGNFLPMPPYGGPMPYGMHHGGHGGYGPPPHHPGMNPFHNGNPINVPNEMNPAAAAAMAASMNARKKRTIDGLHSANMNSINNNTNMNYNPYAFRRTDSSSTATSTVAGNNTSTEATEDSIPTTGTNNNNNNSSRGQPPLAQQQQQQARPPTRHRRNYSGASTASSLSAGGFSISSYERSKCDEKLYQS